MADTSNKQPMRYTDLELSLIKNTFCENDALIKVLRKVILQGELSDDEIKIVHTFTVQPQSMALLRKTLLPQIDLEAPSFQMVDLYINIDTKEGSLEKVYLQTTARDLMCDYLEQQFAVLEDKNPQMNIIFSKLARAEGKTPEEVYIELSMRNTLISHVEFQLMQLKTLAGKKEESVEQTVARLQKNSAK